MAKILVTGATSYLGKHLVERLIDKNNKVTVLSRNPANSEICERFHRLGANIAAGDIVRPETLNGLSDTYDIVYHLASVSAGDRYAIADTNIEGTRNLVSQFSGGVGRFIHASTTTVYGDTGGKIAGEGDTPEPNTEYGQSRLTGENIVLREAGENGFIGSVLRFGTVYGIGSEVIEGFISKLGSVELIGTGRNYANVIHLDDAVAALLAAGERSETGLIYNVVDGSPVQVKEFYGTMAELFGHGKPKFIGTTRIRMVAGFLTWLGKISGVPPVISSDTVKLLTNSVMVSNQNLLERLGLELQYPNYADGLKSCFQPGG